MLNEQQLAAVLDQYELSLAEFSAMELLWHSTSGLAVALREVTGWSRFFYDPERGRLSESMLVTRDDAIEAFRLLHRRRWIYRLTKEHVPFLPTRYFGEQSTRSPYVGCGAAGEMEFTRRGARVILDIARRVFAWDPRTSWLVIRHDVDATCYDLYTNDVARIAVGSLDFMDDGWEAEGPPIVVGPWRERWWKEYPSGWRLRIRYTSA